MSLSLILDRMASRDKDFRYMATSDLLVELQKETFKMDSESERKLCQMSIKLLSDAAGDVQGLAVKCLPLLVRKVQTAHVEEMVDRLFQMVKTGKDEERDISSIGLKTVLAEVPQSAAGTTVRGLTPRLLDGISSTSMEVTVCCLEILHDVLQHFPSLVTSDLPAIKAKLLPELASSRAAVRKRAVACVGALCGSLPEGLYAEVVDHLLAQVEAGAAGGANATLTAYIQAICALGRGSGFRLGSHVARIVQPLLRCAERSTAQGEAGMEVAEHCLQASEALVARCPDEIAPFITQLLGLGLGYIKFDPNYADDDDADGGGGGGGGGGGDDSMDFEDDGAADDDDDLGGEYSDDDDTSWKVRRAAAKLLAALISAKPDAVPDMFASLCPALLARFAEREESVKADVFATTRLLIQASGSPVAATAMLPLLRAELGRITGALRRQLAQRSMKTRFGVFVLLRELAGALPGGLAAHVGPLVPPVERALRDKASTSALRIEALGFLRLVIDSHPPTVLHQHLKLIVPAVLACVADRYYKVCAEALRVCASIARALRPNPPEPSPLALGEYVPPIYEAVSTRLGALDQDQEVKEASIITMGLMIAHVGDALGERLGAALLVLLDRLRNEITRLTAVRAFEAIATSPLNLDLGPTVAQLLTELCSYLRKSSRALRHASLLALHALTTRHARHFSAAHKAEVVRELAPTLSDADMQLAASALALCLSLVEADAKVVGPLVSEHVLPPVLTLLASPLLQSAAIAQMQALLRALVRTNASGLTFETILSQLLGVAGGAEAATGSKQRLSSIALCVAALCEGASDAQRLETVERFKKGIGNGDQQSQLLALHCLGQIGRQMDLSAQRDALLSALTATFDSPAEEVKGAGAFALGCIASGAVRTFLPVLIGQIASAQHAPHHYLLLHALKELILSADDTALQPHVSQILPLLFAQTESAPEDSVKTVVAECLGKLLAAAPAAALPELHARLRHDAAPMRAIAVTALRFAIVDASSGLDTVLPATMGDFFALLSDADLKVRHATLLTLSCVAHNRTSYLVECLPPILPLLYEETAKRAELVHQVDLGPFKHTVDDGLELRKAAYEAMDTILDSCAERLELRAFIARLAAGLTDDYDIKLLCHLVLCKMAVRPACTPALLGSLDTLCEPLRKTVVGTLKDNAVKQEIERHDELVRSGLRVSYLLAKMPGADGCVKFDEYVRMTLKQGKLQARYELIMNEVDGADDGAADPMVL
ncbi:hypothetical protein KFE25_000238 [Diacronema lutheri]|uniref:TATA-binding protein interacting (TIP20) domain-containing protein n=3 Tax=Diacronema lutheri TaxID=2081491 RepID=A0A8J5XIT0_DIALT|nr:hypothetical protein KFE25_000238 [Diacronema lutheri]